MENNAYKWFTVGAGFGADDKESDIRLLMQNAMKAARLLDAGVDTSSWIPPKGVQALYLVMTQDETQAEPRIDKPLAPRRGIQSLVVHYNWLGPQFLDIETGAWELAAVYLLVLATLARQLSYPLPRL